MAATRPDPVEELEDGFLDPECIYRMVSLMCATATVRELSDDKCDTAMEQRVMGVADCYMEYIDPTRGPGE